MEYKVIDRNKVEKPKYSFTKDQKRAIDNIIDFIAKPFNPASYIVGLKGRGGTGKTFITNYIINNCKYANSTITCTSTTHKACRVFSSALKGRKVETIQSVLGLRIDLKLEDFDPINPQFNPMGKVKLENTKLLLIDESSMLPAKLVTFINNICKENTIKIIYIGDDSQLPPVNEKISIAFKTCNAGINELNEIVRQEKDNPIIGLLDLLRYDIVHKTYRFINYISTHNGENNYNSNDKGFSICNMNTFYNTINTKFLDEEYQENIDKYRIVAYTNRMVNTYNNNIRNLIIKDSDKGIITKNDLIMSYTTIVDKFNTPIIYNSEEYIIHDIVDYKDSQYGFKGFMIKFQLVHGGMITKPLFIIDHRDSYTIQMYYKTLNNLITDAKRATQGTRVKKWKLYYNFKRNYLLTANIQDRQNKVLVERDLDYGFAITAHKSQGSTYNTVFVDANDIIYDRNGYPYTNQTDMLRRLYVACSRASKDLIIGFGK